MKEPKPEDFGLTEKEVAKYEKYHKWTNAVAIAIGVLGGGIGLGFLPHLANPKSAVLLLILVWGVPLGGAVIFILGFFYALSLFCPKLTKVEKFKKAKEEFEAWLVRTKTEFWMSLSGRQFEREFAFLLSKIGYEIKKLAKGTGDKGIDILAFKDGKEIIVQCKAHKAPVGPSVIRDLYGTLADVKADKAILASVSGFTKGVIEFAHGKPIELISLNQIIQLSTKEQTQ